MGNLDASGEGFDLTEGGAGFGEERHRGRVFGDHDGGCRGI